MPNKTVNYGLIKPLATEYYDVNIQNGNMDVIDREIKNINDISNKKISELDSKINDMKVSEFKTDVLKKFEEVDGRTSTLEKSMFTVAGNVVDLQTNNAFAVTSGTSTAYTVTLNPAPVAYKDGMQITIVPHINSLSNPTLSVNGLDKLLIVDDNLQPVTLKKNIPVSLVRVGNYFFTRKGQQVKTEDLKKIIDDINAGITDITKRLGYGISYSDPINVNRNDITIVSGSDFYINNVEGRKVVGLSNGWIICGALIPTSGVKFYVSKDMGATFSILTHVPLNPVENFSIVSKGTKVHCLVTHGGNFMGVTYLYFDALTVANPHKPVQELDNYAIGATRASLAINSQGTELHACWSCKTNTYPNSFNIRYIKGTMNSDGSVTWGSVQQKSTTDNSSNHFYNSTMIIFNNEPIIITESTGAWFESNVVYSNGSGFKTISYVNCAKSTANIIYQNTNGYAQSNPSSIFVPKEANGLTNGRIWTTWHGTDSTDYTKNNIRISYSDDGGVTWSTMQKLTSGNTIDRKNPSITANMKTGEVHILYEDGTGISKITWNGTSWGVPTNVITIGTNPSTYYDNSIQAQNFSSPIFMYKATNKIGFYGTWNDSIATETINYSKVTVQDIIGYINSSGRLDTPTITADDKLIFYQNNISKYSESRVYIEAFRFNSLVNGSFKLSFSLANYNAYGYASLRINGIEYKNYMVVDESQDLIENITIKKNDLVQIFVKAEGNGSTFTGVNVGSYKITGDIEAFKNIYI